MSKCSSNSCQATIFFPPSPAAVLLWCCRWGDPRGNWLWKLRKAHIRTLISNSNPTPGSYPSPLYLLRHTVRRNVFIKQKTWTKPKRKPYIYIYTHTQIITVQQKSQTPYFIFRVQHHKHLFIKFCITGQVDLKTFCFQKINCTWKMVVCTESNTACQTPLLRQNHNEVSFKTHRL